MLESYIRTGDGKDYVDVDCVREALGIKEDENIFLAIKRERDLYRTEIDNLKDNIRIKNNALKTVKKERDELKDRVRSLRIQANSVYGAGCGYSEYTGDKAPAFLCNVISYSWNFGALDTPFSSQSIRVELDLTPTASYKGTIDMEDLKRYIQEYGREKKLGIIESVDYQNAKVARAELAYLYKTVLGKEKLDRDLSPHEVMKDILDEYKRIKDAQFAFSQCLRSVYMEIHEGTGYDINDIYAAPDKLADCIVTRYNSARMSSRLVALSDIDDHIDELCDKYTIVQPDRKSTTKERLDYIFGVLAEHRELANNNFNKAEGFRKEKRAVENVLAELRAKVREIYRSVVDNEWDEHLAYTSALNDINEEYKRLRKAIWEAMDRKPETLPDENTRLVGEVTELARGEKLLIEFRDAVAKAIGMDYPTTNNFILKRVSDIYKERGEARDLAMELDRKCIDLTAKNSDLKQKFEFQSGLRQQWHARYESEHERANGVQNALDREREKCRVKDISLETAKKQYEKVCGNLETAECALNGMKSKVRSLQEEKTKVISALGQDIWDDAVK